jgi:hypothetical protein
MKKRDAAVNENEAVSIQVGFVLNTGMLTAFIAIVLVILSGGFGDNVSTEEELEIVADSIEANMIEADQLAVTSDSYTAFFEPPDSGVEYRVNVSSSGSMDLTVPGEPVTVTRDLNDAVVEADSVGTVSGSSVTFGQSSENVILEYEDSSGVIKMEVQQGVVE